jgi:flagellar biosynthesis chaperone FliJ
MSAPTGGDYVAYAYGRTAAVDNHLLKLGQLSGSLVPPTISANFLPAPAAPALSLAEPPVGIPIVWSAPALPQAFSGDISVNDLLPAPFDEVAPALVFGSAPVFNEVAPATPGINTDFGTLPDLTVSLPTAPQLMTLSIGAFGGVNLPTIDATIPALTIDAPSVIKYTPGASYTSSLLTRLKAKLEDILTNGGTGLVASIENAIWDRGREREAKAQREAIDQLDAMEASGFALPSGAYMDARIKILTETNAVQVGLSREVMIKQAELEQTNVNHALDASIQIEGNLIQYTNNVEQRLFESAKYATEAGVSIYNARVQAYTVFVDAFKARIAIYEAQVRAELAKVEVYKAQLSAEQTKAEINRTLVEQYKVQIEASLSAVEVFKARVSAIQVKADIEKTKIEIYGEQVKGYAARVGAFTAGVEGFRATVQAEGTKQEAYKSKVEAYTAVVTAATKTIESRIAAFQARISAKSAEYDGFKAAVAGESARVQSIASTNSAIADIYKARASGLASYNEVLTKQYEVAVQQAARVAEIGISTAKANAELYITSRTLAVEAAKAGATVSAQLGAAALNANNFSDSNSYSFSQSESKADSTSDVTSTSQGVSQSTNYNYSF